MKHIETALATISNPVYLFLLAFGIYSITRLLSKDSFPPIEKMRNWVYDRWPHDGYSTMKRPVNEKSRWVSTGQSYYVNTGVWLGELIHCPWCLGWWVSLAACTSFVLWPVITLAVMTPFALRVIPGMIESVID